MELNVPDIGDAAKYLIGQRVLDPISLDTEIKWTIAQHLNFVKEQIISSTAVAPFIDVIDEVLGTPSTLAVPTPSAGCKRNSLESANSSKRRKIDLRE